MQRLGLPPVLLESNLGVGKLRRGKVRDVYDLGDRLLLLATDRISAFDVVLPNGIPGKGITLTQISNHWFEATRGIVPNHLEETDARRFPGALASQKELAGRTVLVRKAGPLPIECIVRGYLAGSGWKDYQATGTICGIALPKGLKQAQELPEPIFTPSTKAQQGHDVNITEKEAARLVGSELLARVREASLKIYTTAARLAKSKGVLIADTKFEFGTREGNLVLIDELLTPDSSRFWPADDWRVGTNPPSFDKQFVRDWLESTGWDKKPPAPMLPSDVVAGTTSRYLEAYRRLTGRELTW